ncbi:hypothetical protein D0862_14637 [Hortaea werneckii]|uniref:Uncharacterized protein n=1 Tax=Hortaea werneckii TaxID=91943 RepID=A0A3M7E4A1_HORWE|nr:hypothetical protein D0862_14637 [Hortaea werneckii]
MSSDATATIRCQAASTFSHHFRSVDPAPQPEHTHNKKPSMPSLLNPHIPRTSTTPKRSSPQQQPPKLSSAHIDIWEHAALLYHHFEWQSAIETFQHLAGTIPAVDAEAKEARTLCALNAAIIQARLGDYALAAATLEGAAQSDVSFVLTPYLLGIVEWELGNLIKAEACLEICLLALRRHRMGEVDFSPYGLEFRLRDEVVREVLKKLRGLDPFSQEGEAQSLNVGFAVFSADCIFEAPAREGGGGLEEEEDIPVQRRREGQIVSAEGKAGTTRQPGSLIADKSSSASPSKPTPTKNPRETLQELKAFLRGHHHHQTPLPPAPPATNQRPPQNLPLPLRSPAALPVATTAPPADATYHSTWRRRPPTPYVPRDARGEYHSVGELARFIRRYRIQSAPMSPRDPRGQGESTGELARFLRSAGPRREGGGGSMVVVGGLKGGGEVESLLELYLQREDIRSGLVGGGGEGEGGWRW